MKESKSNHCRSRSVPSSTPSSAGPCAIGAWCCTGSYGAFPICKLGTVLQQSGTILPCRAWSLGSLELGQWETWEHWRWLENSFILEFLFKSQSRRARDSCWWKRCFMLRVWPTCNRFFGPIPYEFRPASSCLDCEALLWSWWRSRRPTEFWN